MPEIVLVNVVGYVVDVERLRYLRVHARLDQRIPLKQQQTNQFTGKMRAEARAHRIQCRET